MGWWGCKEGKARGFRARIHSNHPSWWFRVMLGSSRSVWQIFLLHRTLWIWVFVAWDDPLGWSTGLLGFQVTGGQEGGEILMVNLNLWLGLLQVTQFAVHTPLGAIMLPKWLCQSIIDLGWPAASSPIIPSHHSPSLCQRGQAQQQQAHINLRMSWQGAKTKFWITSSCLFLSLGIILMYVECNCTTI